MNYYLKKRMQKGIDRSDMAIMLGIGYDKYSEIERGVRKMPTNLIDKFNEIINKGKEIEITKAETEIKADEFWNEVKQKNGDHFVLIDKMREFNISSLAKLAKLLGYSSVGTIYNYLEERNVAGKEFKKRLYMFFNDELNIQASTQNVSETKTKKSKGKVNKELDRYYEKTNFKDVFSKYGLTNSAVADAIGVHNSLISRMANKKAKPGYAIIQKVKELIESVSQENDDSNSMANRKYNYRYMQNQVDFFNSFNLIAWLREKEIIPAEFAVMCGLSEGSLYNFDSYKGTGKMPTAKTINAIKRTVDAYENKEKPTKKENNMGYISKQKIIDECQKEIESSERKIAELNNQVKSLQDKMELAKKFIILVKSL